jgi:hypothetical protein
MARNRASGAAKTAAAAFPVHCKSYGRMNWNLYRTNSVYKVDIPKKWR